MPPLVLRATRALLALLCVVGLALTSAASVSAATLTIYTDSLAQSWQNYSWADVDLAASAPVRSGSASIRVNYGAWQGLYLHHPGISTAGVTTLRFYIHGGNSGGQQIQVYAERAGSGQGPMVSITAPVANAWREVRIALSTLEAVNSTLTGLVWQDRSGGTQPGVYIDDIALIGDESPDGPQLSAARLSPHAAPADAQALLTVSLAVSDPQGAADIASVTLDASALGRGIVALRDDGLSNDAAAGDGRFGTRLSIAPGTPAGEYTLLVSAQDKSGHRADLQLGAFVVYGSPGGSIPGNLPQPLGWGSNEWSETPGQDWQVNSGVAWDYAYQYITWGWEGWGGNFVGRFVNQAWDKGYIPVISVYLMLDVPPSTGESAAAYASKLQNASTVSNYLASLAEAARQARGNQTVIFHLEPDFYGFMQQLSQRAERPAGVQPDNPGSYPVALNLAGYPNTLAGFGRRMVDIVHATAPNALVAPHASMWATDQDPNNVTATEVSSMARRTAAFINAMGGAQADLYFVEWSDRDAGSGLRPWWDDQNLSLPRFTRVLLWEQALSAAAGKRLILWQVPAGNLSLDDTCNRYRDNRVAYAFAHPRELIDAGVIAVLIGGGAACMTAPSTDGGFIAAQGAIAYAAPAAPTGLSATPPQGASVQLRWNANSEPDLLGYRLSYTRSSGGANYTLDAGRASASRLLLPTAGSWRISVQAYDAYGKFSPPSNSITVSTSVSLPALFIPLARR